MIYSYRVGFLICLILFLTSCTLKSQLFQTDSTTLLKEQSIDFSYSSKIVPGDKLQIDIYNKTKKVVFNTAQPTLTKKLEYLVDSDGTVILPILQEVKLQGLTEKQASNLLTQKYKKYYIDPFVKVRIKNKKVYVFGENGGQVIPIDTQYVSLYEILAKSGGLGDSAKKNSIQIISGELGNQKARFIDMTNLASLNHSNLLIPANSIVYIRPRVMRSVTMTIGDLNTIIGLITNTFSSYLAIDYIVSGKAK